MLLDVLSELAEIQVCTAYEVDGKRMTNFPSHVDDLRRAVPVLETLPGWQKDITGAENVGFAAGCPELLGPNQRLDRTSGGRGFDRSGSRTNDLCGT